MKAVAKCPKCGKQLSTTCEHCVGGGTDVHDCNGNFDVIEDINWKVIDCTNDEAETLRKMKFKGKIPEPLE